MLPAVPLASTGNTNALRGSSQLLIPEPCAVGQLDGKAKGAAPASPQLTVLPPLSRHSASRTTAPSNAFVLLPHPSMGKGEQNAFTAALRDPAKSPCFLSQYASDS